jgi:glycosyltransferase involved in cell wall biosynthesis
VLSGTNPTLLLFILYILKKIFGFKWILLVHDVFPDNLIPAGILDSKKKISYRILNRIYENIYSKPDKLVVIGRDMSDIMSKKIARKDNIVLINNWADDNEFLPYKKLDFLSSKGFSFHSDSVVFQFFGNIGRLQGIDNLLQSIKLTENRNAVFLFFGGGAYLDMLTDFIGDNSNINIFYGGEVSKEDRNSCLASCDVAFVTLDSGMYGLGVPSKTYFSMCFDKPILAVMDANSEIARVVTEDKIGWYCEPKKPKELAHLIDKIAEGRWKGKIASSREVLIQKYSQTQSLHMFSYVVRSVLSVGR